MSEQIVAAPETATGPPGSGAVAAGSRGAADAAARILALGGSAVDAVVAAGLAATMTEPVLASLGGGGFLAVAAPGEEPVYLDFFVDVPGRGLGGQRPGVTTVVVHFGDGRTSHATQEFHCGWGSVAVPGTLAGLVAAQARWGRLPLVDVVAPALEFAVAGTLLDPAQLDLLRVVRDVLAVTPESAELYADAAPVEPWHNPALGDLLGDIGAGLVRGPADAGFAVPLMEHMRDNAGSVTWADIAEYRPVLRRPITAVRGGAQVWTNPPPSFGGAIVLDALGCTPRMPDPQASWTSASGAIVAATQRQRERDITAARARVATGTTHVSVAAPDGTLAAMSLSTGSCSGTVVRGVQLNNMLGEEDLAPRDAPAPEPGSRMGSMMAPTVVRMADGARLVMGTGGSERIRSALLTVLVRLLDHGRSLPEAVGMPRIHATHEGIQVEPGLPDAWLPTARRWPQPNLYFGGVHGVRIGPDGWVTAVGDTRRGGAVAIVAPGT